jgi:hypothetical protein
MSGTLYTFDCIMSSLSSSQSQEAASEFDRAGGSNSLNNCSWGQDIFTCINVCSSGSFVISHVFTETLQTVTEHLPLRLILFTRSLQRQAQTYGHALEYSGAERSAADLIRLASM